jgi:hypothetical protein
VTEPAQPPAAPEPAGPAGPPGPAQRAEPSAGAEARVGLLATLSLAALGVPVAGLWLALAPRVLFRVVAGGGSTPVDAETKGFIADDGTFFLLTAAVGLACGTIAYLLGRRYGPGLAIGLAAGGLAGAVVAWKLGTWFGSSGFHHALRTDPAGATLRAPLSLRAKGALVAWPIGALVALVVGIAYGSGGAAQQPAPTAPGPAAASAADDGDRRAGEADEVAGRDL